LPDEEPKKSSDITPRAIIAAAVAGALATALISGVGLAGSLIGGALFPVVIMLGREVVLRVADRVPPPPLPTRPPRIARLPDEPVDSPRDVPPQAPRRPRQISRRLRRVRWGRVLAAGLAAGAIVVGFFTLPELIIGESLVTDRRTTFFNEAPARNDAPAMQTETDTTTHPEPATTITQTQTTTAPATETTTEAVPAPAPVDPGTQTAPAPEEVSPPPEAAPSAAPEATPTEGALPPPQETPLP